MNLAKLSRNGQITVPAEVRQKLHVAPGDKLLFVERSDGEVVVSKATLSALGAAQESFAGAADDFGVRDQEDVQKLIDEVRGQRHAS
ncbi:MAG: AbrB/MazE/SpoVT family DNA-binding domain-containing protein [Ancrocorticia sp.]|uniref:AbrB/MazE/SpoVT family DNA-binding domain-containing protein n=1 Tax=Ancrocorticia sp. TaxID=2593684 RepID=UPI003F8E1B88